MRLRFIAIGFIIVLFWQFTACQHKPVVFADANDVANAMVAFSRTKNYEKAIQIGQDWLRTHEKDSSIYQQVGIVYLLKARSDPAQKEESLNRVIESFNESLRLAPRDVMSVYQAARAFEIAAELARTDQRCAYYQKAKAALEQQAELLVQDQAVVEDRTVSTVPLRKIHDNIAARIDEEMAQAHCPQASTS